MLVSCNVRLEDIRGIQGSNMKNQIISAPTASLAPALIESAKAFAGAARAPSTRQAYRRQWAAFEGWCVKQGLSPLPAQPASIALYLTAKAEEGWKVAGLSQALAAISVAHTTAGHPSPRGAGPVKEVLAGIRRTVGTAQRQASPLLKEHLKQIIAALPDSLLGLRDRALLLVGFFGAFRRSELVGLSVEDLKFTSEGLEITLRRSKTDQEGAGHTKGLPYAATPNLCPVRALQAWLEASHISSGPVFREVNRHGGISSSALTGRSVARILKRNASSVGLDSENISGHSLRAGFATQAARSGRSERSIQRQTGHKSVGMLRRYIRDASLWTENAAAGLLD